MITQYSDGQLVVSAHHLLTLSVIEYSSAAQNSLLLLSTNMLGGEGIIGFMVSKVSEATQSRWFLYLGKASVGRNRNISTDG